MDHDSDDQDEQFHIEAQMVTAIWKFIDMMFEFLGRDCWRSLGAYCLF